MHETAGVGMGKRMGELLREPHRGRHGQRPTRDSRRQMTFSCPRTRWQRRPQPAGHAQHAHNVGLPCSALPHPGTGKTVCMAIRRAATPLEVPGVREVAEFAGGAYHTCARRLDGTVVRSGDNSNGALGSGTSDPEGDDAHTDDVPAPSIVDAVGLAGAVHVTSGGYPFVPASLTHGSRAGATTCRGRSRLRDEVDSHVSRGPLF